MALLAPTDWFSDSDSVLDVLRGERLERRAAPTIPGYEQVEEICRGGQGVVYSAIQRSTHRRVALKVLLHGVYATAASLRRFEREIELVAALRHPGIVRVYDSGLSDEGRPYCVMEFIDGAALDQHLRAHPHSVNDALRLFLDIADAVHHAHQHGVMHRDLKPSNIRIDAAGRPHVLDFGLAKPANEETRREASTLTVSQAGHFFGSLPWASPEQVRGDLHEIDLRCDVYALGVILYQSLTGRFPYDVSGPIHEVAQRILTADPERPARPGEKLHDDLSTIVLKCLAKDPARRYQTAGDLAADLRHYLAGEPIEARADSTWYVFRKALHRHRTAAWSAALLVALLAGFAATMSVMYRQTAVARDRAQAEADKAAAVNGFLCEMLMSVEPGRSGYRVTVAEVLDQAARAVPTRFARQPDIEAALEHTIGEAYVNLGRYDDGIRHVETALAIRRHVLGPDHPDTLISEEQSVRIDERSSARAKETARDRMGHVFSVRRRTLGPDDPKTLEAELGFCGSGALLDPQRCEAHLRVIAEHAKRALGENHTTTVLAHLFLVNLLNRLNRPVEAEAIARRELAVTEKLSDPEHRDKVAAMSYLGECLLLQKRYAEALPFVRFPYEVKVRVLGARHPATLSSARQVIRAYQAMNQHEPARAVAQLTGASETDEQP